MKATGIVRRIDELGRVVIPKEIRRVQHIRSGDSLEIFMEENGEVVGLYILHPNNEGRCGHIANASYAVERGTRPGAYRGGSRCGQE